MKKLLLVPACLLALSISTAYAQTDKEKAMAKAQEAIKLEDTQGKFDEALVLLDEAQKLDPENYMYPYERAYTYTKKKEYQKAVDILQPLLKHANANGGTYQALANNYDILGQSDKAMETYETGLKMFPKAGEIYSELATMAMKKNDYKKGLQYMEQGIRMAPKFPTNYYKAAIIYCMATKDAIWGMIYGEIFMNMEPNTQRTREISKLLFDTYKKNIVFLSDNKWGSTFVTTVSVPTNAIPGQIPLSMVFDQYMIMASQGETGIDINSANRIRAKFISIFKEADAKTPYNNILFDFQAKIREAGHLEAYNYWLLNQGDQPNFASWYANNKDKMDSFLKWVSTNRLVVDDEHKFTR